jgi:hypothetical protein
MKRIINIVVYFFFLAGLSSCLKDKTMIGPDSPGAVKHVVEFLNPAVISSSSLDKTPLYVMSYDITPSAELNIQVSYSGGGGAPNDIHVKVALDANAIKAANDEQEADMIALPSTLYTVSSLDVVIPKGEKTATLKFTLTPDKFDLSKAYALALKIESVTGTNAPISGNFGLIVVSVGAKNKWDGIYKVTGTMVDANGLYKGVYPTECAMISAGANSVIYYQQEVDYPNFLVENIATGGLANTGIRPKFIIDANNNVQIINNATGADITVHGKYNPDQKSFDIEWKLGRWHATEHWVYSESR